jgi:predicted transcriptional regulator
MATTIQVSEGLQDELSKRKFSDRETYEEVIWDMIEDTKEINEETKKELTESRAEIKRGRFITLEQVKKEAGL